MDDRVRGAAYSRGSYGGPRGSSGNGPQSYNRDGPSRRDYKNDRGDFKNDRGDFKNDRGDRDYDRNARSDREGYFQGGRGSERERDDSRRPNPSNANPRRRDDRRRVTDDDDTVMDSQEASSVDRGAPIPSVNIEASSSALSGDLNSNPKPPREQKGRGQRPPLSKRGGGNPGGSSTGSSSTGSTGSGVALPDSKQDKTLVNGTSA